MSTHPLQPAFDALSHEFDAACEKASQQARSSVLNYLNQLVRRFRHYQNETEWLQTLVDGAGFFANQVAIFSVEDAVVRLRMQVNLELPVHFAFPLSQALAFAAASELKDPVTSLRTPSEVTARLSENHAGERAHLFPIVNDSRVVALLFAAGSDSLDVNALELVSAIAATVLERRSNTGIHAQIAVAAPPAQPPPVAPSLPSWSDLPADQRQIHMRAQRFARVNVAEMQIARPEACKAGREQNDLYLFLKREIDKARENYRKQFMTVPSMVDYLHLELIKTAAGGHEKKLGEDYPGQLL